MKYFDAPVEEQETTINISYNDEIVQVYTNRIDVIKKLSKRIGKGRKREKKGKRKLEETYCEKRKKCDFYV